MKEIVKVLLQEGIDEETIHEVLNVIDEKVTKQEHIKAAKRALPQREQDVATSSDKLSDIMNKTGYEYTGDSNIAQPKGWPYSKSKVNPETEEAIKAHKGKLQRRAHARKVASGDFSKFGIPQEWTYKSRTV